MPSTLCQQCGNELEQWTGTCPKCGGTKGLTLAPRADPLLNTLVAGRYRVLQKLGQGGMGSVYMAEQEGLGHRVALKFLSSAFSQDADVARRFLNEAKSYARVAHPNAVTLHDFGQDDQGNLFIAMELVEGMDLKRLLTERVRLPSGEAIDIALQVADVLGYAHAKGVIHRDLKPENIMVRAGMRGAHVKVLDFGIARLMDAGTRMTQQGSIAGTPRYMAPEQVEGSDVDARADVYALGVLLFELITGVDPFDGATVNEILRNQLSKPMPHLQDVRPELSLPVVDSVIQKATRKDKVERYASMAAFATDLSNALPTQTSRPAIRLEELAPPNIASAGTPPSPSASNGPGPGEMVAPFGRKISDTLVRGAAVQVPVVQVERAPSPSGIVPERPGSHSVLTEPVARRSRTPMVIASLVGLVILGSMVAVAMHAGQKPAVAPIAASSDALGNTVTPPGAVPKMQPPSGPPGSSEAVVNVSAQTQAQAVPADVRMRVVLVAKEQVLRTRSALAAGDTRGATDQLALVPDEPEVRAEVAELRANLAEISSGLEKAHAQSRNGDCESAVRSYKALLAKYRNLREASRGIAACASEAPPSTAE